MTLFQVTWLETDLFTLGLGFLMLSMGLTLTFDDFKRCLRNPWTVSNNHLCLKEIFCLFLLFNNIIYFAFAGGCGVSCTIFCQALARLCHCNGIF